MEENQTPNSPDQYEVPVPVSPAPPAQPDTQLPVVSMPSAYSNQSVLNGQPLTSESAATNQPPQAAVQKRSKWHSFFPILNLVIVSGIFLYFLLIFALGGKPGTEFIGLLFVLVAAPVIGIAALINLIGLPIYIVKQKQRGKALVYWIIPFIISLGLSIYIGFGAYSYVLSSRDAQKQEAQQDKLNAAADKQSDELFAAENSRPERSKDEAIQLIRSCVVEQLFYTHQTIRDTNVWGELSSTGVVVILTDGKPSMMRIADSLVNELVPIAREAQTTCNGNPALWHDGDFENQ